MPRNPRTFDAITSNGYRPGFEPRPGETEAQRLKREMAFLKAESDRKAAERRKKQQEERTSPYGGPSLFNYRAPVAPQAGYRRGFEPRPGESESERLKREVAWLTAQSDRKAAERRRQQGRAAGGPVSKSKPKPMPTPTDNKKPKPLAKGGMARPGIDTSSVVDPREDIVVTAPRNTPKFKKLPKDSPGFSAVKKMPKGSPGFDFGGTSAGTAPKIKKLPKGSFKSGGSVSASRRADGIARKGKTRGKVC